MQILMIEFRCCVGLGSRPLWQGMAAGPAPADWAEQELDRARQLAESVLTPDSLSEWEKRLGLQLRVGNVFSRNASVLMVYTFPDGPLRHLSSCVPTS